jgi:tight adherence protein B
MLTLRTLALVCLLAAGWLAARAASSILWPRLWRRIEWAERGYADRLKDIFRPQSWAHPIARAQYLGTLALAALIFATTGNAVFALALPAAAFFVPPFVLGRMRERRLEQINHQLPDALRVMADAGSAHLSLPEMIRLVAAQGRRPIAEEFGLIVHAMDLGESVEDALKRVAARLGLANFKLMSTAIMVNRDHGGDIAPLLIRLSTAIRAISDVEQRIETETAAVRMSAKIMVATIPLFAIALFFIDPAAVSMLFSTSMGAVVLVLVAVLATAGYRMILRLANPEV